MLSSYAKQSLNGLRKMAEEKQPVSNLFSSHQDK
jgi:hypothetical protein